MSRWVSGVTCLHGGEGENDPNLMEYMATHYLPIVRAKSKSVLKHKVEEQYIEAETSNSEQENISTAHLWRTSCLIVSVRWNGLTVQ